MVPDRVSTSLLFAVGRVPGNNLLAHYTGAPGFAPAVAGRALRLAGPELVGSERSACSEWRRGLWRPRVAGPAAYQAAAEVNEKALILGKQPGLRDGVSRSVGGLIWRSHRTVGLHACALLI